MDLDKKILNGLTIRGHNTVISDYQETMENIRKY